MWQGFKDSIGLILFWGFIIGVFAWSPVQKLYDEHKITCSNEAVLYQTTNQDDPSSYVGTNSMISAGTSGSKDVCTRGDGTIVSSNVTLQPVNEIDSVGTKEYTIPAYTYIPSSACVTGCADGTCSPSTGRGTCSHHGGEAY